MKSFLNAHVKAKIAAGMIAVAAVAAVGFNNLHAQSAGTLSGSCSIIYNISSWGKTAEINSQFTPVALGIMNFDAGTYNTATQDLTNSAGWINKPTGVAQSTISGTFVTTPNTPITGMFRLVDAANAVTFNVVPSNSSNTYLITLRGTGGGGYVASGVCQKI